MTVSTTENRKQYSGNGVTTEFSFPYLFYADGDLKVYLDDVLQTTGYSVAGSGEQSGGAITFDTAPDSSTVITIQRIVDIIQGTDFENFDGNPSDVTEKQFDLNVMMAQQNANYIRRSLKYPSTIAGITDATLPTPVNGSALLFSGTTGKIVASADYITDAIAAATSGVTGTSLVTATSTTSLTVTGSGNKTWIIQSGRGFAMGQRLRAASDDGTKINEGRVTSYSGTTLIINVDHVSGSGTHADWNISVIGDRGAAGAGTGDLLAANNLSDVASAATAFNTIKQQATTSFTGVVELATDAEAIAGTDTVRAVTPSGLQARCPKFLTAVDSTFKSGTGTIPNDDTIPQNTEGNEFITITYTPTSATNRLQIRAVLYVSTSLQDSCTAALFQDSTANALAATKGNSGFAGAPTTIVLEHDMVAGTTSPTTFKIRCGSPASSTTYFNSDSNTGARKLGGVASSRITIMEYTV